MKTIILMFFLLYSQASLGEQKLVFSVYEGDLSIHKIDSTNHVVTFLGEIAITGTLVFGLDMLSETEFGEPLFIDFIPDPNQLRLLSQVVDGYHAKRL